MRGKFRDQLRRDGFAIEPLLQHVERLHPAVAHDQKLAVDGAGQVQRVEQIGKAFGNVLAGARIEPRDRCAVLPRRATACTRMPSHFHSAMKSRRIECGEIGVIERMRQHRRPERRRVAARRFVRAAFEPGEQLEIGRREAGPQQFDLLRILAAERRDRGLGQPRRDADAQAAGHELDQRPAPGLVERIEPARELRRQLRLAERGERFDDGGESEFPSPLWGGVRGGGREGMRRRRRLLIYNRRRLRFPLPTPHPTLPHKGGGSKRQATSARRSRRDRRHNRRTARTAPGRCARRSGCG